MVSPPLSATGQVAPNESAEDVQQRASDAKCSHALVRRCTGANGISLVSQQRADDVIVTSTDWVAAASDGDTVTVVHGQETVVTPVSDPASRRSGDGLTTSPTRRSIRRREERGHSPDPTGPTTAPAPTFPTFEPTAESMAGTVDATTPSSAPGSLRGQSSSDAPDR